VSKRFNDGIRTKIANTVCEWSTLELGRNEKMNVTFQDVKQTEF